MTSSSIIAASIGAVLFVGRKDSKKGGRNQIRFYSADIRGYPHILRATRSISADMPL